MPPCPGVRMLGNVLLPGRLRLHGHVPEFAVRLKEKRHAAKQDRRQQQQNEGGRHPAIEAQPQVVDKPRFHTQVPLGQQPPRQQQLWYQACGQPLAQRRHTQAKRENGRGEQLGYDRPQRVDGGRGRKRAPRERRRGTTGGLGGGRRRLLLRRCQGRQ